MSQQYEYQRQMNNSKLMKVFFFFDIGFLFLRNNSSNCISFSVRIISFPFFDNFFSFLFNKYFLISIDEFLLNILFAVTFSTIALTSFKDEGNSKKASKLLDSFFLLEAHTFRLSLLTTSLLSTLSFKASS